MATIQSSGSDIRLRFFDLLFANQTGYLCIASKDPRLRTAGFQQKFFFWPDNYQAAEEYILRNARHKDVYFCINLLEKAERRKEWCMKTNLVWADLDEKSPFEIEPTPPFILKTSKDRYQAIWRLTMLMDPPLAEAYSKRIAYAYKADRSGWDLTQLLRVPLTFNHKTNPPQLVEVLAAVDQEVPPLLFEMLPKVEDDESDITLDDVPTTEDLPDSQQVIYKFQMQLNRTDFNSIYSREAGPKDDWSKPLWKLIHICLEAGMTEREVMSVVKSSPVNKYDRDQRPITHLWRDILKAKTKHDELTVITADFRPLIMPQLVHPDYEPSASFVSKYRTWAEESTDAVPQFHDLAAFILLSAVIANSVRLETSYGTMVPNLWGIILGDSTLTRKTTAMRMVMDLLNSLNKDMILGTDGSAEGLLSGLEQRPNRTSIFFRDELSGFFDAINRKDYLAGMPETFTHLYDVPTVYTRRLRKEVIRLESPVFIFFGGGVKDKVYEVLNEEYITSGFIPRFLVVSGDTDLDKLRRTGPATNLGIEKRAGLVSFVADLYEMYAAEVTTKIGGETIQMPPRIMAILTEDAWEEYGRIEELMVRVASESSIPNVALPTFERLSRSLLKMSMILGAIRQQPSIDNKITIEKVDVMNAAWYVEHWGVFSVDLISNTGKGTNEKQLDKILNSIKSKPGILRSTLMRHHHLTKKQADDYLSTLEDRMLVIKERTGSGNGAKFWAV